jgi:hypothetical protein
MVAEMPGLGGPDARRLILRQIQPDGLAVAHLLTNRAWPGERDQAWELADLWESEAGKRAALVVTRRVGDVVRLLGIMVNDDAPPETVRCLVQQLVAILRRTDASVVWSSVDNADLHRELLAAGFVPLPEKPDAAGISPDGPRIILQL